MTQLHEIQANGAFIDLSTDELVATAVQREEGRIAKNGALNVNTGKRTGRSPKDRFIVEDDRTRTTVDWGAVNQRLAPEVFEKLWNRAVEHVNQVDRFISHLRVGSDPEHYLPLK